MSQQFKTELYPTFENHEDKMEIKNFNELLNRYIAKKPIVSNEERRILCNYFSFSSGDLEDVRMCKIDKGLADA